MTHVEVVTVSYLALINPGNYALSAATDAEEACWYDVDAVPSLGYDHHEILDKALQRIRAKLSYEPIGFELLATEFPFGTLEGLYQTILGQEIDRRNFRKKLLSYGFLLETGETYKQ